MAEARQVGAVPRTRSRARVACTVPIVVVVGLATRGYPGQFPQVVAVYGGDTMWALAVFLLIGSLLPTWSACRVGVAACAVSLTVELSQLYHAPWLDAARGTRLGGLILGYEFLWSDLACYSAGVAIGVALDRLALTRPATRLASGRGDDR